jgi:hypothetical protein
MYKKGKNYRANLVMGLAALELRFKYSVSKDKPA